MAAHAAQCHQLMRQLGITRAHIVGHSSSVPVALQLALDAPETVHTLTLMEAARPAAPTGTERQFGTDVVLAALQHYRTGGKAAAPDTRDALTRCPPGDRTSCPAPRRPPTSPRSRSGQNERI